MVWQGNRGHIFVPVPCEHAATARERKYLWQFVWIVDQVEDSWQHIHGYSILHLEILPGAHVRRHRFHGFPGMPRHQGEVPRNEVVERRNGIYSPAADLAVWIPQRHQQSAQDTAIALQCSAGTECRGTGKNRNQYGKVMHHISTYSDNDLLWYWLNLINIISWIWFSWICIQAVWPQVLGTSALQCIATLMPRPDLRSSAGSRALRIVLRHLSPGFQASLLALHSYKICARKTKGQHQHLAPSESPPTNPQIPPHRVPHAKAKMQQVVTPNGCRAAKPRWG